MALAEPSKADLLQIWCYEAVPVPLWKFGYFDSQVLKAFGELKAYRAQYRSM